MKPGDHKEPVLEYLRERMDEEEDNWTLEGLHEECAREFPELDLDALTKHQFWARYPLCIKRERAAERKGSWK